MERDNEEILRMNAVPRDLKQKQAEEDDEIELSLGLSMNGRFGVDPSRKKLRRSSSVSNLGFSIGSGDEGSSHQARAAAIEEHAPLARTCSLPAEMTEEWRRRKEVQSMKSMEARKKRMEKLKNVRVVREKESYNEDDVHDGNGLHEDANGNEKWNLRQSPEGSIGSRSGSSGASDLQSHLKKGGTQNSAIKSSSSLHFPQEQRVALPTARAADRDKDEQLLKDALLDMPYVSTKGYGPNSNKIEGFLYRYKKGEEVKIVCVCHGSFLSPAEFVKHGGGGDVAQPLKHIVVNPFPLF